MTIPFGSRRGRNASRFGHRAWAVLFVLLTTSRFASADPPAPRGWSESPPLRSPVPMMTSGAQTLRVNVIDPDATIAPPIVEALPPVTQPAPTIDFAPSQVAARREPPSGVTSDAAPDGLRRAAAFTPPPSEFGAAQAVYEAPQPLAARPIQEAIGDGATALLSSSSGAEPLRIAPPSDRALAAVRTSEPRLPEPRSAARGASVGSMRSLATIGSSLAGVLGLFFLVVWIARRSVPASALALPSDVFEVLGRAPLDAKQHLQLVRVGGKLVLLSRTATGVEPLTEITDPDEVDRLTALCRQSHPQSISATFRQVFSQMSREPVHEYEA